MHFPAESYRHSLFPSAFTYSVCCPWNAICAGVTGQGQQQAMTSWMGWKCLMAQSMLAGYFKSGKGTLALLFAPSFLLLMLSFYQYLPAWISGYAELCAFSPVTTGLETSPFQVKSNQDSHVVP